MKKRTATSTFLISLAAMGCGQRDSEYVEYQHTAPLEMEPSQSPVAAEISVAAQPANPSPDQNTGSTAKAEPEPESTPGSVKPASHVTDSKDTKSKDTAKNQESNSGPRSIVSAESGLSGSADVPQIDTGSSDVPNKIELLIPEKSFRKERGTDAVRISYDDIDLLKVLNMEPVPPDARKYFPDWLAGLDGKRVRIRGWMYPTFVSEGLTSFTMARDNGICCFQRMPKIYDVIFVKLAKGQVSDYIAQRPFDVEGTFRIDAEGDGTELPRLYKLEDARVLD